MQDQKGRTNAWRTSQDVLKESTAEFAKEARSRKESRAPEQAPHPADKVQGYVWKGDELEVIEKV